MLNLKAWPIFPLDSYYDGFLTFLYPGHLFQFASSTQGEGCPVSVESSALPKCIHAHKLWQVSIEDT